MKWICAQWGAREHYAIPRALHRAGDLELCCTDFWAPKWLRIPETGNRRGTAFFGGLVGAISGRFHPELEHAPLRSWNSGTLGRALRTLRLGKAGEFHRHVADGQWFAQKVCRHLQGHHDLRGKVVFSYDTTALELLAWAKKRGATCVLGQVDPARVEQDLVREEAQRWPGWQLETVPIPEEYNRRREVEWGLADLIIVNSQWSYDALRRQGVPAGKLRIVPLCYDADSPTLRLSDSLTLRPLSVLFLGQVILRKGIQYLYQAAQHPLLRDTCFEVVGPIGISAAAVQSAPPNVRFHGPASREAVSRWYLNSDLFVLPTLSDGFAITQIEALAHGLPVIATPNCGEIVRDGQDGLIVPSRDAAALAAAILRFAQDRVFLAESAKKARVRAKDFTLAHLQRNLSTLSKNLISTTDGRG